MVRNQHAHEEAGALLTSRQEGDRVTVLDAAPPHGHAALTKVSDGQHHELEDPMPETVRREGPAH